MPFIVQCPHPDCRKHMLLEDAMRGAATECLVCKRMIQIDPAGLGDRGKPPRRPRTPGGDYSSGPAPPTTEGQQIANCPGCHVPLRIPPSHEGRPIRCPRCNHVFAAQATAQPFPPHE